MTEPTHRPSLREVIMLDLPMDVKVAPDGRRVAVLVRTANWRENCYEQRCEVHNLVTGASYTLNHRGSVDQMAWLDGETLALLRRDAGQESKPQIWLVEGGMGEGWPVTDHPCGVEHFQPFAGGFLFLARHPERQENKKRAGRFGKFTHFEQEPATSALYYVDLPAQRHYRAQTRALTEEEAKDLAAPVVELSRLLPKPLAIYSFVPSPTGDALYLNCRQGEELVYMRQTQVFAVQLDAAAALAESMRLAGADGDEAGDPPMDHLGTLAQLPFPPGARVQAVSPDGRRLLVAYKPGAAMMYTQEELAWLHVDDALTAPDVEALLARLHPLTAGLDREILDAIWREDGIYASYADRTQVRLLHIDGNGERHPLDLDGIFPAFAFDVGKSGVLALIGANAETTAEAYVVEAAPATERRQLRRLTETAAVTAGWRLGSTETIRWQSRDGVEIEGVLLKPPGFDPGRRYPLVFVVHGGPTWFSTIYLLQDRTGYPVVQFLNEDILVLKPNYRGSLGYGQDFMALNVDNLGVGDLWDLESAIDHLVALGWVDPERVGCMGWSQGGYISAFAGLHSTRFKAVSVGAGISDWYTYHIGNDIPDFTVDYLSGSPFLDRERYVKTAPISNLANARTPMLIQHGEKDRRVPFANATELYRGLRHMGVPVELFVYPEMGHSITKPRENHAVLHQNLAWFSHYLLGHDLNLE